MKTKIKLNKRNIKRIGSAIGCGICVILIMWIMLSFFDTNSHNLGDQTYHSWNFFTIFMKMFG